MKRLFLAFLAIFLFGHLQAQNTRPFSEEPQEFLNQVGDMFISINKTDGEAFILEFSEVFNSFPADLQKEIITMSNVMVKKRFQPSPDFYDYFTSLIRIKKDGHSDASFAQWRSILDDLSKGSSKKFSDFIRMSGNLYRDGQLFQTNSITWMVSDKRFEFLNDSVPLVKFGEINLIGHAKGDSTVIEKTSGLYLPVDGRWYGEGGTITWERAGISRDQAWAELSDYTIILRSPHFIADSVVFYNKKYFNEPLMGAVEERVLANVREENANYPKFQSYQQEFVIKNIIEGVDYIGGFSQSGGKFVGSGTDQDPAQLVFYRKGEPLVRTRSKTFFIRDERILTDQGDVTIYLKEDSIYHPGLQVKLLTKERQLTLFRDMNGISKTPYFNTYHQMDMDFEALYWNLDEPLMNLQVVKGSTQTTARFESANFYSSVLYQRIMEASHDHPLLVIHDVAKAMDSDILHAEDIARHWKLGMGQVEPLLFVLSNMGFITFNTETKVVTVKSKLYDYILANGKKKDYDIIEINSDISGRPNATLSLLDFDLSIRGVTGVILSDSQNVIVRPRNGEMVMRKNRNFVFGGTVSAGLIELMGQEFSFDYENFKINLTNVDSMIVIVKVGEPDERGRIPVRKVRTVIQEVKGDILIDSPGNKSGLKDYGKYPVLNSREGSFAYYDSKSIQKGSYDRDRFYFKINPFTMDSLDDFANDNLEFEGTFTSAGIFPEFDETLKLQPDFSLGFVKKSPAEGFPVYGGKSNFKNEIHLSHEGLKGNGDFTYLHSISQSEDFTFYPDSMTGIASSHVQKEQKGGTEFPSVNGEGVAVNYRPVEDFLSVTMVEKPMEMFENQANSHGTVFLQPSGLTGEGKMTFQGAEMESELYSYRSQEILADTANFRLASFDQAEFAFKTNDVNAHIDFTKREGKFKSNGGGSFVEFPINQYLCFMDQFVWNMDKDDIEMSAGSNAVTMTDPTNSGLDLSGSKFISTHPGQDSLSFFAPSAKYDLKNHIIRANGVKFFNVADAMLYPDSGIVVIEKKAVMQTLENSKVLANFVTQYHNIYDASINVYGKKSYAGSGKYDYINELDEKQVITLHTLATDTTGQTYGKGTISDSAQFKLSPRFDFRGDFNLYANNEFLKFDGLTRIYHDCAKLQKNWMRFTAEINPEEVYIPVDESPRDDAQNPISNGLVISPDSVYIYSTFVSLKDEKGDKDIVSANGFLYFDKASEEFRIGSKEKLTELSLPGNYLSLNTRDCKTFAEGKMEFGMELGQVKLNPVGNAVHNLNDNSVVMDVVLPVNFFFDNTAMDKMAEMFTKAASAEATNNSRPVYEKALREIVGTEEADKLIAQIGLYGSFKKLPSAMENTILFSDVKMKWIEENQSFRSVGKIGVGSIGKTQVNKMVSGYIDIQKKRSGDIFNVYLELDGGVWYFFSYTRSMMQAISSSEDFNNTLMELKADKRRMDVGKGETPFTFMLSTARKKSAFLKQMETGEEEDEESSN